MDFLQDAFLTVLNMSITASYVAVVVMVARLLLKKAPKVFSYVLWSVVLFRLLCPFSFSSEFSLFSLMQAPQSGFSTMEHVPRSISMMDSPAIDTGVDSFNAIVNTSLPSPVPGASINPIQLWIALGTMIWLLGAAVLLAYGIISCISLKKKIRMATLVSGNVYETDLIRSPFVWGFVKPRIYLPVTLGDHEREYILLHEGIHIQRLDYLVKPLWFLALVFHWFNPLMWLCFSLMAKDMEMSCDEQVMAKMSGGGKAAYSSSLLAMAIDRRMPSPIPLAFGESNVKARIKNILNYKKPVFWVVTASIAVVILLVVALVSNPAEDPGRDGGSGGEMAGYDMEALIESKTPYIGNNAKVVALIDAMPLPKGVTRDKVELSTSEEPYGMTIHYKLAKDSWEINGEKFFRNSVMLLALIDNAGFVTHTGQWGDEFSFVFQFTHTQEDAEEIIGGDIRRYAENSQGLQELIQIVQTADTARLMGSTRSLELYVWRKPELTGNNDIYYTLLRHTNRRKEEHEVYDLSIATSDIGEIRRQIANYGFEHVHLLVSHPLHISKEEMDEITNRIEMKNGSMEVGTGWFEGDDSDTSSSTGGVDGPKRVSISPVN